MILNKNNLDEILNYQFIKKIKKLSFVQEIWLFGSRARGDHHPRSDIDLAILCQNNQNWNVITQIIENADTLLHIDCIYFKKENLSHALYHNILKDKKILYMKKNHLHHFFLVLNNAIERLEDILKHPQIDEIDYLRDATIQRFEFSIELFWKTLKKILSYEKIESSTPRDTLAKAYQYQLIDNEKIWLNMLDDRNNTSHAYNEKTAQLIFENIKKYLPTFQTTFNHLNEKYIKL